MPDHEQQITTKERVSTYLYICSLYFVTVGVLYLWGYWATFNVNILEYLSLADILKSTAYPVASAFIFTALGLIFGEFFGVRHVLPPGGGRDTTEGKWLNKYVRLLVIVYVLGCMALLIFGPVNKWLVLPVLVTLPVSFLANERGLFASLIPHDRARSLVIFLLVWLLSFAYGLGRLEATDVLEGKDYKYVTSQIEGIALSNDISPDQRLRLLGHAGDFLFLLNPSNSTLIIMKFDQAKILQIKEFKASSLPFVAGSNTAVERDIPQSGIRPPIPRSSP
jgi:hypothetical protein